METIREFISQLDIKDVFSQLGLEFPVIITLLMPVISAVYLSKSERFFVFNRERHDKLIAPLFFSLEPFLYKEPSKEIVDKLNYITTQNRNFADGKLCALLYYCKKSLSKKSYNELCQYIDKLYDKSCRKLHLKRRPYSYRAGRRQYEYKFLLIWNTVKYVTRNILIFCFAMVISTVSFTIFGNILGLDSSTEKLLVYSSSFLVIFALVKYTFEDF